MFAAVGVGGDVTLLIHKGRELEFNHAKGESLLDRACADDSEFRCVLQARP